MLTYRHEEDHESTAIPRGGWERKGVLVYTLHTMRVDGNPTDVLIEFLESTGGSSVSRQMVGLRTVMYFATRPLQGEAFFGKDLGPLYPTRSGRGNKVAGGFLLRVLYNLDLLHPAYIEGKYGSKAFRLNTAACESLLFDQLAVPGDWKKGALEGDKREPPEELRESRLTVYTRQFHGCSAA